MELYQLRTFVIVAKEENVTKAAKRLFTTPPSVSAHIKALEEELNVKLFERTPKGMKITEKGEILRVKAEQTLRAAQDLANHATRLQEFLIGTLNFGLNATPAFLRVAEIVKTLQERSPGLELNVVASDTGKIIEALAGGRLDAGYIFGAPPQPDLISHRLGSAELVVAAPRNWVAQLETAPLADIAALPWIASNGYCPFQTIAADLFKQRNLAPKQIVQSGDEATKRELVEAGLGLALLEKREAEQAVEAGKVVLWATEPISCDLFLAFPAKKQDDPLIHALRAVVLKVWTG